MKHTGLPEIDRRTWNLAVGVAALNSLVGGRSGRAKESIAISPTHVVYVSISGNNSWSGRFLTANKANADGPVASIHRALEIVRNRRHVAKSVMPAHIILRSGTYELREPIMITPEDSGTAESPLIIAVYQDEKPIISGGITIRNCF